MTDYNGWTNYETWLVKLWIDNDEATQGYYLELANGQQDSYAVAMGLREGFEDVMPKLEGFWADMMNAAMSEVNWGEIAESLIEDAKELAA